MPGGYVRVPVTTGTGAVVRSVYVRQHKSKDAQTPRERTLFVGNIPSGVESGVLLKAWQRAFGRVEAVTQAAATAGGANSVLVVFRDPASIARALAPIEHAIHLPRDGLEVANGAAPPQSEAWAELRDKALKAEANRFMLRFDAEQAAQKEAAAAVDGVPDDDGFVTVTRGGKRGKRDLEPAQGAEQPSAAAAKKKRSKTTELHDFYQFQQHERKRDHLQQLRQRFEQDKQRVAAMKAQRRFRPE
jgi:ribosomal RNA-processing protein 7